MMWIEYDELYALEAAQKALDAYIARNADGWTPEELMEMAYALITINEKRASLEEDRKRKEKEESNGN